MSEVVAFVPGKLTNPLNGSHGHWSKHRAWAKAWREKAQMCLYSSIVTTPPIGVEPRVPKLVTFTAFVGAEWDDDNLRAALKPCRDALKDMALINDDRPSAGHTFVYHQRIDGKRDGKRGVEIRVAPADTLGRGEG